ncbi:hypothetical protein Ate02nite_07400 [Paractinoplanes tereljensis]|uniref:Calx-beta domain-containing protein n=3 Tax=Paractinoplanes tereljensis TaxID=571912 RepID=A0A919NG83_9ACTN|nr:hypothetical protein Ate02nite_07400 [Actinoplanes tereljensis]
MRHRPIQTAPPERVPFTFWGRHRIRTVLAAATASAVAFVPAMLAPSPAYAVNTSSVADISVADAANWEGGKVTFTVTYTGAGPGDFTFSAADLSVGPGHAVGNTTPVNGVDDYDSDPSRTSITFPGTLAGGNNTTTVSFATENDGDGVDEDFQFVVTDTVSNTVNATGTIWSVGSYPNLTIEGPSSALLETAIMSAGGTTQRTARITATIDTAMSHDVTIPLSTAMDTNQAADDQAISSGGAFRDFTALPANATIVIPAYSYTGYLDVELFDDALDEPDTQYFWVQAGTPLGAQAATGSPVEVAITDDDSPPSISIGDAPAVTEGGTLKFPLTLSAPSEKQVTAHYTSADGTKLADSNGATLADSDYTQVSAGSVNLPKYTKTGVATIVSLTDGDFEGPENVRATLGTPDEATLGTPATGTGIINDADGQTSGPTVTLTPLTFKELDSGEMVRQIHASLPTGPFPTAIQITYKFKDGTAKSGIDYKGTDGSFTIPAGTTSWTQDIPVTIYGDKILEGNENFKITLASPNGTIHNPSDQTVTIDESGESDSIPTFTTSDVSVTEGNSGTTYAKVPIALSGPSKTDTVFSLSFADGSAVESGTQAGANDYDIPADATVTIKAGDTAGWVNVPINGDLVYERDQVFSLTLATASTDVDTQNTPDVLHTSRITIGNDDAMPTLTFNSGSVAEGQSLPVTGSIVGVSEYPYTLGFTVGAGNPAATNGTDFTPPTGFATAAVSVPRGSTGKLTDLNGAYTYSFSALQDTIDEPTEAFTVTANETTGALTGFTPATGTFKITDDPLDLPPAASIGDVTVNEKDKTAKIPVDLTFTGEATSTVQTVTIPYYTEDGTAKAGKDYKLSKGTIEVPPGTMKSWIEVPLIDDHSVEPDETFAVHLGNPGPLGASVVNGDATVTIKSDDKTDGSLALNVAGTVSGGINTPIWGKAAPGAMVELWGAPISTKNVELWKLATVKAGADGTYKFVRTLSQGYRFKVSSDGDESMEKRVNVTQAPVFVASSPSKGWVSFAVQGTPRGVGQVVIVQRWVGGKWVNTWTGTTGSNNQWKATAKVASGSSHTVRAFVQGFTPNGIWGGYSATKKITIK